MKNLIQDTNKLKLAIHVWIWMTGINLVTNDAKILIVSSVWGLKNSNPRISDNSILDRF